MDVVLSLFLLKPLEVQRDCERDNTPLRFKPAQAPPALKPNSEMTNTELLSRLAAHERHARQSEKAMRSLEADNAALKADQTTLRADKAALVQRVNTLDAANAAHVRRAKQADKSMQKLEADNAAQRAENATLLQRLSALECQVAECLAAVGAAKSENQQLRMCNRSLTERALKAENEQQLVF